ncbi:guanylate kinase isoform X1 [Octopus sinensis]|uniref:guanylate kinase n=2 Tax=Octopus sinensis TaxID=2607531 RepID=A0A6P7TJK4_9MOLL|nr:guanylate kinase isoform X1 [Octopus sinensis]
MHVRALSYLKTVCSSIVNFSTSPAASFSSTALKMSNIKTIVISGPSGAGKSTLLHLLMKDYPTSFAFSVSHTTRKPRPGEVDGKDYHFVTHKEFEEMIQKKKFLENAMFSGNYYGTSKAAVEEIQKTGRICILDVEINGVKSIKTTGLNAKYIFVQPPSIEALEKRLRDRKTETEESLQKRLDTANEALDYSKQPSVYDHIIVNDKCDEAYQKLKEVVQEDIEKLK